MVTFKQAETDSLFADRADRECNDCGYHRNQWRRDEMFRRNSPLLAYGTRLRSTQGIWKI